MAPRLSIQSRGGRRPQVRPRCYGELVKRTTTGRRVNGHGNGAGGVVVVTRPQLEARAEKIAQDLLGKSREHAFKMLDQGELRGTLADATLSPIRDLLK